MRIVSKCHAGLLVIMFALLCCPPVAMADPEIKDAIKSGSRIFIIGSGFAKDKIYAVDFSGVEAQATAVNEELITVDLPKGAKPGPITIRGKNGERASSSKSYAFSTTTMTRFAPESAAAGKTVIISGDGFDRDPAKNVVKLNGTEAKVIDGNERFLAVEVPDNGSTGPITWQDSAIGAVVTTGKNFTFISRPKITAIDPDKGATGTAIVIKGEGFDSTSDNNEVRIGNTLVKVNKASDTSLEIVVPEAAQTGDVVVINSNGRSTSKTFVVAEPDLEPSWKWAARVGGQTSSYTDGAVNNETELFSNNYLFLDLSLTIPQMFGATVDGNFVTRFGRHNVEGETQVGSTTMQTAIKDAATVEAYGALIWKPALKARLAPGDKNTIFYIKPTAGFIYNEDNILQDQDVLREFTFNLGWMLSDKSYLSGSLIEIGGGYSERFEEHLRFKSTVEIKYNTKSRLDPFIAFKYNMGTGPDDLVVYYGVSMDPKILFQGVGDLFTGEGKKENTVNSM